MPDLRVMIVAEDTLSRAGLAALLGNQPGLLITGQVAAGGDLAGSVDVYRPEVVLWDLGWDPSASLVRLVNWRETAGLAQVPLVVLLANIERAAEVWGAGVRGLLLREAGAERLAAALQGAAEGLVVLDPDLAGALVATRDHARDDASPPLTPLAETLTPREIEVLRLLAEGLPNKAIARRLAISEHTVKFHVNAILGKLGVESRTEAVVRATRLGLVLL
jgi:two-component system, NarL family, nitrate/nitrite response regulator NarL